MQRNIKIHPYDPNWPADFSREAERIGSFCSPLLVRIEHVGSTAVPGLHAKPIIDISVGVVNWNDLGDVVKALEAAGYQQGESAPPPEQRLFFFMCDRMQRTQFHLHVTPIASESWNDLLAFRDALRRDGLLAAKYQSLKEMLAGMHGQDIDAYTDGKTAFIYKVLRKAK